MSKLDEIKAKSIWILAYNTYGRYSKEERDAYKHLVALRQGEGKSKIKGRRK
jgi:hypothetical protein